MPERVIPSPMSVFTGSAIAGTMTRNTQHIKNNMGNAKLTRMGRCISGLECLKYNKPAMLAATDNHSI